jgi:hypothetical protein
MRPLDHLPQTRFRIKNQILLWNHPPRHRQHTPKEPQVEQDRLVRGDFEAQEEVWVDQRCDEEDGGE